MKSKQASVLVPFVILVILSTIGFAQYGTQQGKALRINQREITVRLNEKPLILHSKEEGWAELPALATTPDYIYVAYDVREGYESHLYLARVARKGGKVEKIQIDHNGDVEFGPSICVRGDGVWVVWTSYRDGKWTIRASRIDGMIVVREVAISDSDSFSSQVRLASARGLLAFTWVGVRDKEFAIKALFMKDSGIDTLTIYRSSRLAMRPDLCALEDGWVFVWDEFINGNYATRMRKLKDGALSSVVTLSGERSGNNWEPHLASDGKEFLVSWHRVPHGEERTQPALTLANTIKLQGGIDRPSDDETWRVRAFSASDSSFWIVWATRRMYRSTRLFLKKVDRDGLSDIITVDFPMPKNFINWFDLELAKPAIIAWEYSGTIYLGDFDLPRVRTKPVSEPGEEMVSVREMPKRVNYTINYNGEPLKVYFGDHHNHTSFSDGRAYPDMVMMFARYRRGLDFICVTDHDVTLTPGEFAWTRELARTLTDKGEFVCLHGYEPSKGWAQHNYGHWNMLYFDGGDVFQYQEGMTPHDLQAYAKAHDAVLIPHHVAKKFAPYAWDFFDEAAQPVVEMCSVHGVFEMYEGHENDPSMVEGKFIQDGLARGYRFGFVGASDYHNCFSSLLDEVGLTGAYVTSLSLGGLHEAYKKRRTFALTGGRIVVDFRCNGHLMGEEIQSRDDLNFRAYASSPDTIKTVEIMSWGEAIYKKDYNKPEVEFNYKIPRSGSETYYYLRVRTAKGDFAWSSPIWVTPSNK